MARDRTTAFVGRRYELEVLAAAAADAHEARSSFVVVSGETGIGKSRLLREFVDVLGKGATPLWGGAPPVVGPSLPLAPLAEMLRRLSHEVPEYLADYPGLSALVAGRPPAASVGPADS